jgi:methyl-accepting chemotaxis protein
MKNWTISRRIVVGFTVLTSLTLVIGLVAIDRFATIRKESANLTEYATPGLAAILQMQALIKEDFGLVQSLLLADDAHSLLESIEQNEARVESLISEYRSNFRSGENETLFGEFEAVRDQWITPMRQVMVLREEGRQAEAVQVALQQLLPQFQPLDSALDRLTEYNLTYADGAQRSINLAVAIGRSSMMTGLVLAIAIATLLSLVIVRGTNRVLRDVSNALDDAAAQLSAAASQVSAASQSLAEGASEQAASLEETSASLEEIGGMTRQNASHAGNARTLATETWQATEAGSREMAEMVTAMNAIKGSSDNIANIIKTIDEIAFQTNILALNAAVEAARAGEAGAGFAVVADEVRSLAQRAADAAKETAEKIDDSVQKSSSGVEISARVANALQEISVKSRRVNELVVDISNASKEQSQGLDQVGIAVSQMDKVTQSNASNAEETAAAAEELNAQAALLLESVERLQRLVGRKTNGRAATNRGSTHRSTAVPRFATVREANSSVRVRGSQRPHVREAMTDAENNFSVALTSKPSAPSHVGRT